MFVEDEDEDRASVGSNQSAGRPNELCDGLRKNSSTDPRVLLRRSDWVWEETRNGSGYGFSVSVWVVGVVVVVVVVVAAAVGADTPKSKPPKPALLGSCCWLSTPACCSEADECSIKGSSVVTCSEDDSSGK